ncbi:MAG: thioredoxin domain-containing protein [Bacteroidales bacterium]|nr:thioredoxin domain-containing protein [Bacteroidales bacterium]
MTLRRFKTVALLLCAACLALAGWMLFHSLTGARMAGCGAGSGCDSVMGSPWAYVLGGVPVSLPAAVAYVLLALCLVFLGGESAEDRSLDRLLWPMMLVLGGAILGAAIWFCYLQLFVLHAFCKYCTLLHLLGILLAGWILFSGRSLSLSKGRPERPFDRLRNRSWFAIGLLAAALFAFVQSRTLPAAAYDTGRTEVALPAFTDGEIPVLGPSDAPDELTLLFDFQCNHCRRLHQILPDLLEKAGGQYRIRLCPVPLSSACNPYIPASGIDRFAGSCALTRNALAVWYARPDVYEAYWDYLLGGGDERASIAPADAEARARALLGDGFQEAIQDPRIDAYLRKAEELFGRTSNAAKSGVPRLIHGQRWLVPETDQADELLELIRLSL